MPTVKLKEVSKSSKQKTAKRASKMASKSKAREEEVRALLKTEEEVAKMKSEQKNARETILAAGYSEESLDHAIKFFREEFKNNPLGRSMNDSKKAGLQQNDRKFLAEVTNTSDDDRYDLDGWSGAGQPTLDLSDQLRDCSIACTHVETSRQCK